jgi:hypothetical protein
VSDEQLADLLIQESWTRKIEPESLGGQPAAIHELNVGVEVGAVLSHSAGVYEVTERCPPVLPIYGRISC